MIENNLSNFELNGLHEEPELNLRETIFKYLKYWYYYVIIILSCFLVAYLYLRYTIPVYEVRSEIIIKDDKGGGSSSQNILSELDIFNTKNNVLDEIEILKTRYLMEKVVAELNLNIGYFEEGNITTSELYNRSPFYVTLLSVKDTIPPLKFKISKNQGVGFFIDDSINVTHRFDDTIVTPYLSMAVHRRPEFPFTDDDYFLTVSSVNAAANTYLNSVSIMLVNKQSNVIEMTMSTTIPKKGEDILNKLYEVYTRINREDKNKISDSTIKFINDRLEGVTGELSDVEKNVEQFKKNNKIPSDFKDQSSLLVNNISDLEKQMIQQDVQINVVESIEKHLKSDAFRIVPGALVIQDPTYLSMVDKYNMLVLERDNQLQTAKEGNPLILGLNQQILNLKADLLTSLANIKRGMVIAKNDLSTKNNQLIGQVNTTPSKERAFIEISRQQSVKQELYLYLLQKREETAISKSGTLANSRLIEPPKGSPIPFKPNRLLVYLIAIAAGLLIPTVIIYLSDLLNNKISSKSDFTKLTNVPIFGELGHNTTGEMIVARQDSRTVLAEQFRLMRTNLQFILKGKEHQVIMMTSSMSGEGKSFLCINLASSLAISGKRVVLMELDLRKPKISKALGLSGNVGFTNYLVSNATMADLITPVDLHENLFVISAGIIPPNPAELLLQDKVAMLFENLRKDFDFIIIDTAPVGLVTDALLISKYSDANIYVMRQNYTLKEQVNIVNDLAVNNKMPNLSILLNDVSKKGTYGYGYRSGYGYGYGGKGYYTDQPEKKSFFKRRQKS